MNIKRLFIFVVLLLSLVILSVTLRGAYGNPQVEEFKNNLDQATKPFELSPERGRFLLTMNLSEHKSFALNQEYADAVYPDVGWYNGKFFIYFAPGISVLVLPFYELGKLFNLSQVFTYFVVVLFGIANMALLYYIARRILKFAMWSSLLVPLIFMFGSISWGYATTLYQHHFTAFCLFSGFVAVYKFRQQGRLSWLWAIYVGLAYGASIFFDLPNAILLLPVPIYLILSAFNFESLGQSLRVHFRTAAALSGIVFVMFLALQGYYNNHYFGHWSRLSHGLLNYKQIVDTGGIENSNLVKEQDYYPAQYFHEQRLPQGISVLFFSIDRGLFVYSPIFLLALIGMYLAFKDGGLERFMLISIPVVHGLVYASWADPWGGWAFGPRYLIPAIGILALFVVYVLDKWPSFKVKLITFVLFLFSSAVAAIGAVTSNAAPPKKEAIFLEADWGFKFNLKFFPENQSSSFVYNNFLSEYISLAVFTLMLLALLFIIAGTILFVMPKYESES
ncbi:MAG TPA: hypothetical protein VD998_00940 [Verrucomicrobiae bacterium]|nr:hypothetical protein [Verrucomicrobiae bacterium]